jgi:hypothetical protein
MQAEHFVPVLVDEFTGRIDAKKFEYAFNLPSCSFLLAMAASSF